MINFFNRRNDFLKRVHYDGVENLFVEDKRRLFRDLENIGNDMWKAIEEYERERVIEKKNGEER